ncbi:hypothetical protein PFISCL1PPCAC_25681, partial [Pristionchus fissidentatus]
SFDRSSSRSRSTVRDRRRMASRERDCRKSRESRSLEEKKKEEGKPENKEEIGKKDEKSKQEKRGESEMRSRPGRGEDSRRVIDRKNLEKEYEEERREGAWLLQGRFRQPRRGTDVRVHKLLHLLEMLNGVLQLTTFSPWRGKKISRVCGRPSRRLAYKTRGT